MKRNLLVLTLVLAVAGCFLQAGEGAPVTAGSDTPQADTAKKAVKRSPNVPAGKININTAGVRELDQLPGVGPAVAQRIISYRQEHGRFQKAEDLMAVKGIGEKIFAKIRPYVSTE